MSPYLVYMATSQLYLIFVSSPWPYVSSDPQRHKPDDFLKWCVAFASSHEGDEGGKGTRGGTKEGHEEGDEGEVNDGSGLRDRCVGTGRRAHCSGLFVRSVQLHAAVCSGSHNYRIVI